MELTRHRENFSVQDLMEKGIIGANLLACQMRRIRFLSVSIPESSAGARSGFGQLPKLPAGFFYPKYAGTLEVVFGQMSLELAPI